MDEKTRRVLMRISSTIPPELASNITKDEIDTSEEEIARDILKRNKDLSPRSRKALQKSVERGDFRRSEKVVNEDVAQQVSDHNEREVRKAIADGRLPDPSEDPFVKARNKRLEKRNKTETNDLNTYIATGENIIVRLQEWPWKKESPIIVVRKDMHVQQWAMGRILSIGHKVKGIEMIGKLILFKLYESNEITQHILVINAKHAEAYYGSA